ncbi:endoplasmic reticulum aminopeptidase 1-like isoform X1 [Lampetra planeri]
MAGDLHGERAPLPKHMIENSMFEDDDEEEEDEEADAGMPNVDPGADPALGNSVALSSPRTLAASSVPLYTQHPLISSGGGGGADRPTAPEDDGRPHTLSRLPIYAGDPDEFDEDFDDDNEESSRRLLGAAFFNRDPDEPRSGRGPGGRAAPSSGPGGSDGPGVQLCCQQMSPRTLMFCAAGVIGVIVVIGIALSYVPCALGVGNGCASSNGSAAGDDHDHHGGTTPSGAGNATFPFTADGEVFPWADDRLPRSVRPLHYHLCLHPNLTTLDVEGYVSVWLLVDESTDHVVLHANNLTITESTLVPADGAPAGGGADGSLVAKLLRYEPRDQLMVCTRKPLTQGQIYLLNITFTGRLSTSFLGFYRSTYRAEDGSDRPLAVTQFEPTSARESFPCFDEPDFKASFDISIVRDAAHTTLSNMPLNDTVTRKDGLLEDTFKGSVVMSTYLVAFIVSDFKSISNKTKHGTNVSIYTSPGKEQQGSFALENAIKFLDFYEELFNISYPLPKQDLVAIPDFAAGAMENWGLITYRETALLLSPKASGVRDTLWVAQVIAHELAHQWFGNLVTMNWWNDLWLNEGFATFMEFVATDSLKPDWLMMDAFLTEVVMEALTQDSLPSSHAISSVAVGTMQIGEMFDSVSYNKGASVLNMLRTFLTPAVFVEGIRDYLLVHSYSNAHTDDLWESLTQSADQHLGHSVNVTEVMGTWVRQRGFPLLTLAAVKELKIAYKQEPFPIESAETSIAPSSLWQIPLTFITSDNSTSQSKLITDKQGDIAVTKSTEWIKANTNMTGFYVVDYGKDGWATFANKLTTSKSFLSPADRANLLNDVFYLLNVGRVDVEDAMPLLSFLPNETNVTPWKVALMHLDRVLLILSSHTNDVQLLQKYIVKLGEELLPQLPWNESREEATVPQRSLDAALVSVLCTYGSAECLNRARAAYKQWSTSESLSADLMGTVLRVAVRDGDQPKWDSVQEHYHRAKSSTEQAKYLEALASTSDEDQQWRLLENATAGVEVRSQELPRIVGVMARTSWTGRLITWDFLRKRWGLLVEKFSLGSFALSNMVMSVTSGFSSTYHLDQVEEFVASLRDGSGDLRVFKEARDTIRANRRWLATNRVALHKWLTEQS